MIPIPKIPSGTRPFTGRDVTRPKSQKKGGRTLEEARAAGRVQVPTYNFRGRTVSREEYEKLKGKAVREKYLKQIKEAKELAEKRKLAAARELKKKEIEQKLGMSFGSLELAEQELAIREGKQSRTPGRTAERYEEKTTPVYSTVSPVRKPEEKLESLRYELGQTRERLSTKRARGKTSIGEDILSVGVGAGTSAVETGLFIQGLITKPIRTTKEIYTGTKELGKKIVTGEGINLGTKLRQDPFYYLGYAGAELLTLKGAGEAPKIIGKAGRFTKAIVKGEQFPTKIKLAGDNLKLNIKRFITKEFDVDIVPRGKGLTESQRLRLEKATETEIPKQSARGAFGYSQKEQAKLLGKTGVLTSAQTIQRFKDTTRTGRLLNRLLGQQEFLPRSVLEKGKPLEREFYTSPFDIKTKVAQARISRLPLETKTAGLLDIVSGNVQVRASLAASVARKEFLFFRGKVGKIFKLTPSSEIEAMVGKGTKLKNLGKIENFFLRGRTVSGRMVEVDTSKISKVKTPAKDLVSGIDVTATTEPTILYQFPLGSIAGATTSLPGGTSGKRITTYLPSTTKEFTKGITFNYPIPSKPKSTQPVSITTIKPISSITTPKRSAGTYKGFQITQPFSILPTKPISYDTTITSPSLSYRRGSGKSLIKTPRITFPFKEAKSFTNKFKLFPAKPEINLGQRAFGYTAGFPEIVFGIKGRKPKRRRFTGFEFRPIPFGS